MTAAKNSCKLVNNSSHYLGAAVLSSFISTAQQKGGAKNNAEDFLEVPLLYTLITDEQEGNVSIVVAFRLVSKHVLCTK